MNNPNNTFDFSKYQYDEGLTIKIISKSTEQKLESRAEGFESTPSRVEPSRALNISNKNQWEIYFNLALIWDELNPH